MAARILNAVPAAFSEEEAAVVVRLELVDTYLKCTCYSRRVIMYRL